MALKNKQITFCLNLKDLAAKFEEKFAKPEIKSLFEFEWRGYLVEKKRVHDFFYCF